MKKKIKQLLFGKIKKGENIINKQPTFKTYAINKPDNFNDWIKILKR